MIEMLLGLIILVVYLLVGALIVFPEETEYKMLLMVFWFPLLFIELIFEVIMLVKCFINDRR